MCQSFVRAVYENMEYLVRELHENDRTRLASYNVQKNETAQRIRYEKSNIIRIITDQYLFWQLVMPKVKTTIDSLSPLLSSSFQYSTSET